MLRKLFSLILCLLMVFSSIALADMDLTAMSFEELCALKVAIEAELNSRPEAEPFDLSPGLYTVGKEIKAGRYYIMASLPNDYSSHMVVYSTKDAYDQRPSGKYGEYKDRCYLEFGEGFQTIDLEDGNYLYIQEASIKFGVMEFTEDDYYKYIPPEGTYVPAGIYIGGEDIPAGVYQVYPANLTEGDVYIYENKTGEGSDWISHVDVEVTADGTHEMIQVRDGNKVKIDTDVVMKKQPKLNFD